MADFHIVTCFSEEMVARSGDQLIAVGEAEADDGIGSIGEKLIDDLRGEVTGFIMREDDIAVADLFDGFCRAVGEGDWVPAGKQESLIDAIESALRRYSCASGI